MPRIFIIQTSMIVLYTTDNLIITQLFSPEMVVPYTLAYKYFNLSQMLFLMVLTPFWSGVTEAYTKNDIGWIKKSMNSLMKIMLLVQFSIFVMVLISSYFYELWVGTKVVIPFQLTVSMALFFCVSVFFAPFNYFINGIGKIRLHMYSFMVGAIINVPLSIICVGVTYILAFVNAV